MRDSAVSGFPLKCAFTSKKKTRLSYKTIYLTLASPGWTSEMEREVSETGARLKRSTLAQRFLHLDSAAATDDLSRFGGEAPGLVGLIVSQPWNHTLSHFQKIKFCVHARLLTHQFPLYAGETALIGKGVHQVGHNILWKTFLIKAIAFPKAELPLLLGKPWML